MIIDFHAHLAYHKVYPDFFIEEIFSGFCKTTNTKIKNLIRNFLIDKDGSLLFQHMKSAGITKSVLLIIDSGGKDAGYPEFDIKKVYKIHYEAYKLNPDSFIIFAGINPLRKDGIEILKKGIFEFNFKGIKLYPPFGFKLHDKEIYKYYEFSSKNNLPILIHTGASIKSLKTSNYLNEIKGIEEIAQQFPDVKFILAHAGFNIKNKLLQIMKRHNNIYTDFSGFQSRLDYSEMNYIFNYIQANGIEDRVVYGSDWPLFNLFKPLKFDIEQLKKETNFPNKLFYKNANLILQ